MSSQLGPLQSIRSQGDSKVYKESQVLAQLEKKDAQGLDGWVGRWQTNWGKDISWRGVARVKMHQLAGRGWRNDSSRCFHHAEIFSVLHVFMLLLGHYNIARLIWLRPYINIFKMQNRFQQTRHLITKAHFGQHTQQVTSQSSPSPKHFWVSKFKSLKI